ncbi:hypothetical protein QNH48_16620 [Neobacillus sp. YX16]|uniref:hypothetical protein n=1 Tax=Neobacillus sp. YX16 TaxID=3047874 RepID=UPI0024C45049|nr:hypothetical protein [Neobacillus sp. YX16]WHZ00681.1 hypothetical protein QNH48_16620 [Neobacillus sp. YX16]
MERTTQSYFEDLQAEDKDLQYEGFNQIMAATQEKVGWAYDVKYKKKYAAVWRNAKIFEGKCG